MATKERGAGPNGLLGLGIAGLWLVTYIAARLGIEALGPGVARTAVALLPVLPFVAVLWYLFRAIAGSDELERRIQHEALAVAFPATMLMLMVLGLLDLAVELNPADWSYRHLWPFMVVFWLAGLARARWRYS